MSIKELPGATLVPDIHSYSGFIHKRDGKHYCQSSLPAERKTTLYNSASLGPHPQYGGVTSTGLVFPTVVVLLMELGKGGKPFSGMICISSVRY